MFVPLSLFAGVNQPVTIDEVDRFLHEGQTLAVEDFLDALPAALFQKPTFLFSSQSLQGASPLYPRTVIFDELTKLFLTFNGHPSQVRFFEVEGLQYDQATKKWTSVVISFDPRGAMPPVLTRNPPVCLGCHGSPSGELQPQRQAYLGGLLPGVYGSLAGQLSASESAWLQSFIGLAPGNRRYAHVTSALNLPWLNHATEVGYQLNAILFDEVATEIETQVDCGRYRYAFAGALRCTSTSIPPSWRKGGSDFLPPSLATQQEEASLRFEVSARLRLAHDRQIQRWQILNGGAFVPANVLSNLPTEDPTLAAFLLIQRKCLPVGHDLESRVLDALPFDDNRGGFASLLSHFHLEGMSQTPSEENCNDLSNRSVAELR